MPDFGLIQVYTGNGKGKTSASLGLALRACGHGFKVCMIQFMKGMPNYGEIAAVSSLDNFTIIQTGRDGFINLANPDKMDIELALKGWEMAKSIIESRDYNIIILDEINLAMDCNLLCKHDIVNYLEKFSGHCELILTGCNAPQEILAIADLVTEMKEIKSPNNKEGTSFRLGINY